MKKILTMLMILLFGIGANSLAAGEILLAWDPNTEPDLAGYRIYYGNAHDDYTEIIDVGNVIEYTITELNAGVYYITITAYDASGNESDYTYEIAYTLKVGVVKRFRSE